MNGDKKFKKSKRRICSDKNFRAFLKALGSRPEESLLSLLDIEEERKYKKTKWKH